MRRTTPLWLVAAGLAAGCGVGGSRDDAPADAGTTGGGDEDAAAPPADIAGPPGADTGPAEDGGGPPREDASGSDDGGPPPEDAGPRPDDAGSLPDVPAAPATCAFRSRSHGAGHKEVNTWREDVPRVSFEVPGLPDPATVTAARLRYFGYDVDHPGAEGWIEVNGPPGIELPADPALDNAGRSFEIDVLGRTVAGLNRVDFVAFDGPEGAYYRVSDVELVVTARGLDCAAPPVDVTGHDSPVGVSAFAGLAPHFPRADLLRILAGLSRPFTAVLLDFGPVYGPTGVAMYGEGAVGDRQPNPRHLEAVAGFLEAYAAATPGAEARHLQLFLLNGPGHRRQGYPRAYPHEPGDLDGAVRGDEAVRAELRRYLAALTETVAPFRDRVDVRLVVALEDNLSAAGAQALLDLARDAGWPDPIGRNPCGCPPGDSQRVGDFHEEHVHGGGAIARLPGGLRPPDSFSNDGWGWSSDNPPNGEHVTAMARKATETGLSLHVWYDPIQGYPIVDDGPRDLRFDHPPGDLLTWLTRGLDGGGGPTGEGVQREMSYRDATYEQRRNWVLDCRDYAYSARGAEHRECDQRYDPDGTTHGRAVFTFEGVVPDRYEVRIEGRHTINRNPAGTLVVVNGVEARIPQRDERDFVFDLHGVHDLAGRVTVVVDSTREVGSDSVRTVRLTPVR